MKQWFRYWAEYPFAHTLSKEEEYFYVNVGSTGVKDSLVMDDVREWAEETPDGRAIAEQVGRSIRCGFERIKKLPPEVRDRKMRECYRAIEHHVDLLRSLKGME